MTLVFLIFWPLLVSLLLLIVKFRNAKEIALATSLLSTVVTIVGVMQFTHNAETQFVINEPWITSFGINFSVGMDGISLLLVLLTNVLVPFIILSSFGSTNNRPSGFYGLILMMQMALVGVFVARDGFLFFLSPLLPIVNR